MAESKGTPHFHNEPGVPVIYVGSKEFMCIGAKPPMDHPHIFCDMGRDSELVCSYCSTLYKYDPSLKTFESRPAECAWVEPEIAADIPHPGR
ncbi:zinc-finger domain-containing protein [Microvirga sp. 17 mud 1-3]|uniref:zinc-finger domain-containing protein n=1 Tax=Microvirga sp. 17 mud 1-3 TaxID=2082949 RepID=UPI000D6C61C3|nr:zinc-finger domain-containing protein [Microvirga sp. 17 mud 1-3]AWM87172.1 zinc-finger domain-containing protein [Microvirga sp. 17 mud 1-3]